MKKVLKLVLQYVLCFSIILITGILLLFLSNKIPSSLLENNIKESANTLVTEGERKCIDLKYKYEYIFNFCDALMLNMAYSVDSSNAVDSMLLSRKDYIHGITKTENTTATENIGTDERFIDPTTFDTFQTAELYQFVYGKDMPVSFEYARYWHGYMIFLRPVLILFNINQIRMICTITIIILSLFIVYLIYNRMDIFVALSFTFGFLGCSFFIVGQSLSEIPVFLITLALCITLILNKNLNENTEILFFIAGAIVGFMDLLTEPIISLFIPLTLYFIIIQKQGKVSTKEIIKKYILICFAWGIGYALTWMSKWIIIDIVKNRGIFKQAIEQVSIRSNVKGNILYSLTLSNIYQYFSEKSLIIFCIIPSIIIVISRIIIRKYNIKQVKISYLPFLINILVPFLWYYTIKNHSYLHPFFAYKLLSITIINFYIVINNFFNSKKKVEDKI